VGGVDGVGEHGRRRRLPPVRAGRARLHTVTLGEQPRPRPRRRRRRRAWPWRILLGVAVVVSVFAAGVALGEALHDNPKPGGATTTQRTLRPLPLAPQTVTVTVGGSG
jgi:hypothetical protein